MPAFAKAATPKKDRRLKHKKISIEPYQEDFPPKRPPSAFVPVSPSPDTVSDDPNTAAEQLKAVADLVSLHLSSSKRDFTHSTPTPYNPPGVSIERGQKANPLQKTSDKTILAVEAGEGSEDTELTETVPTSHQPNRDALRKASEHTGLSETSLTSHQPNRGALQEAPGYNVGEYLFNCICSGEEGSDYVSCIPHTSDIPRQSDSFNHAGTVR
ncbi:uncharacterized protein LOC120567368 [Perca fluviatilis]|uniref:uncharacterized protein LOC120567368 n=1 Tax=Perca fluviatilis TaxID=8168 RepID=UPI001964EEFB|nr:uncharacterized protein LOC120567368 [Perca fluviatilis]